MFDAVRAYLLGEGRNQTAHGTVSTNPKGELTRRFDAEAERIAIEVAREGIGAFAIHSEEAGYVRIGGDPLWTLVLDPCDGSNNFRRGVRSVGFAVAALPPGAPLDPDFVEYALCGDIFTGTVYSAAAGQGATVDGQPCQASRIGEPRHAMIGINLGQDGPTGQRAAEERHFLSARLWTLLQQASTVRRTGATVLDLCYVAEGAYDAYVDVRRRLTPENFMAPALVIREAGGILTGEHGGPLGAVEFTHPYSIIASGSMRLQRALLDALWEEPDGSAGKVTP
jgi:myo-inositol-1(or 4)-monophosphatase